MKKNKKERYVDLLKEQEINSDPVYAHFNSDLILCQLLVEMGFDEVAEEFLKVERNYGKLE